MKETRLSEFRCCPIPLLLISAFDIRYSVFDIGVRLRVLCASALIDPYQKSRGPRTVGSTLRASWSAYRPSSQFALRMISAAKAETYGGVK